MNTRIGQLVSTLLIIGLILFWSASILAAETAVVDQNADAAEASLAIATDANEAAADEAAASIARDTKIELDNIELDLDVIDPNSLRVAAN
jgi:hypothetical protein